MISERKIEELFPYTTQVDIKNFKKVLEHIGVTDQGIDGFIHPTTELFHHPFKMKDMEKALDRLLIAFKNKQKVLFFGDYDTDGVTTTALFVKVLRDKGIHVDYYVPHRHKDGYGLNPKKMEKFSKQYDLIITGDTGIKELETIHNCPIDVIVTDHHEPFVTSDKELIAKYNDVADIVSIDGETMLIPKAFAVVNPKQIDCDYPNKCLSGVAVIFKLLQGLFIKQNWDQNELIPHLDMVATGLVADLVPQFDVEHQDNEVRLMTIAGLQIMNSNPKPWVSSIATLAKINEIDFGSLGFVFGPRFNAPGRLDSPFPVVEFLLEDDWELSLEKAEILEEYNNNRKQLQKDATESIVNFLKNQDSSWTDRIIVVRAESQYHSGIAGLVASMLVGKYNVPAIVLCEKQVDGKTFLTGSCRSVEGVNILQLLQLTEKKMGSYRYGGHEMAAGLTITPDQFETFWECIREAATNLDDSLFESQLYYEIEVPINELTLPLVQFIRNSFYKIRLLSTDNYLYSPPTPMSSELNAKVFLERDRVRYIANLWGTGKELCTKYSKGSFNTLDVVYNATIWNDRISLEVENYKIKG
ncbi:single-stranded-DNA-specific exonuclease RecJ [Bacillus cereus]|uniref:single-stranded-DNA-specific exonuclease RecJ n=1 Tax=Bacillus cereus TaxID=1396 RepID=UPI000B4B70A8|nr:DHH family phosphoesterase [Bacillus cereus]